MFNLETPSLLLIFTPLDVIDTRLRRESFQETLMTQVGEVLVDFSAEWPGDALVIFPMLLEQLQRTPEAVPWSVILVEKSTHMAVGQMGFKNLPDASGMLEVGYGINASKQGLGYATEALVSLVDWSLAQANVKRVTAECLVRACLNLSHTCFKPAYAASTSSCTHKSDFQPSQTTAQHPDSTAYTASTTQKNAQPPSVKESPRTQHFPDVQRFSQSLPPSISTHQTPSNQTTNP
jgi:hypothetical protein